MKIATFPLDDTAKGDFTFHWIAIVIIFFPCSHLLITIMPLFAHKAQNYSDFKW